MTDTDPAPAASGYREALGELEQILDVLERDDVDVDVLATNVERAAELIGFCRDRINHARLRVAHVVAGLESSDDDG